MSIKDEVAALLEGNRGRFVSGAVMAEKLGVSRNSIWKAIKALQNEGYRIDGVTNKGYRLASDCAVLTAASIDAFLTDPRVSIEFHKSIDSTNNRAKALAIQGCPEGTLVVADEQTAGRGRQGRPFFSPAGTGVYFSLVMRPGFPLEDVTYITSFAAVCCAQAIEQLFGVETQIKWVNDIFVDGRKCCGILTEAAIQPETGGIDYVVVGIGINVAAPEGGFPKDISNAANAIKPQGAAGDSRSRLIADIVDNLMAGYPQVPDRPHLEEYRRRSLLDGRVVTVHDKAGEFSATVLGVNDDFTLQVALDDGDQRALSHGEVHIPSSQL